MNKSQNILWLKRVCFVAFLFYWGTYFFSMAFPTNFFSQKVLGFEALLVPVRYQMFRGPFDRFVDVEYTYFEKGKPKSKISLDDFKTRWIRKEFPFSNETFKTDLVFNARFLYTQVSLMRDGSKDSARLDFRNHLTRKNLKNMGLYAFFISQKEFPSQSIDSCQVEMIVWDVINGEKVSPSILYKNTQVF